MPGQACLEYGGELLRVYVSPFPYVPSHLAPAPPACPSTMMCGGEQLVGGGVNRIVHGVRAVVLGGPGLRRTRQGSQEL